MNLLCPNCQKMLTVPEQYAGQLMKCPLCAGTFTVPGLPAAPPATPLTAGPSAPPPETYGVKPEAVAASPLAAPPLTSSAPTAPASTATGSPPPPPTPPPPSGPLTFSLWLKPEIIQWIAPAAVLLILFLFLFFPWVGVYPGGQPAVVQYGWEIPFGSSWPDPNLHEVFHFPTAQEMADNSALKAYQPRWDFLMLLYMLLLPLTIVVTVACAVLPALHLKLPPAFVPILQWRWGIAAVLNFLLFLLLCVQILWGFPLESAVRSYQLSKDKVHEELLKKDSRNSVDDLRIKVSEGEAGSWTARTFYLKVVFYLHCLAIAAAALMLGLERRNKPTPAHIDLVL